MRRVFSCRGGEAALCTRPEAPSSAGSEGDAPPPRPPRSAPSSPAFQAETKGTYLPEDGQTERPPPRSLARLLRLSGSGSDERGALCRTAHARRGRHLAASRKEAGRKESQTDSEGKPRLPRRAIGRGRGGSLPLPQTGGPRRAEPFFRTVTDWRKKIEEGIKHKVFCRLPDGVAQRAPGSSVRQLLCDDVACKVCEQAAQEASQLMSSSRAGGYNFPSIRAPLSHGPCVGRPLQLDTPDSFPQSASAPDPISRDPPVTPTRPASCGRPLRPSNFPADNKEQTFSIAERVSEGSRGSSRRSGGLIGQEEDVLFSSTTQEMSQMSWAASASDLSELSVSSLEGGKSCRCGQVPRKPRKRRRDSSRVKSSAESQTSGRDTESFFLRMRMYSQSSPSEASRGRGRKTTSPREGRSEAPRSTRDPSSSRAQAFVFTAADISFLDQAVVASLESHLLGKRVQHLLGLPSALLRSLQGFVPSAPRPAPQRGPVGVTVVTGPQALSFVAERAKKRLELHLKKMVQMKHWQLPQRVQEALRQMKPPSQPRETPTFPQKKTPSSSKKLARESCSALSCAQKQQTLQRNLAKRALEMQLGVSAPKFQQFRKASPQAPKPALPKVIPPGLRPPEPRSQQIHFLDLQALGHIQLNITHKKLTYRLGLPSLYHRSLAQLFPGAVFQAPTFPLPRRSVAFGFTSTHIRFLCPKAREELEWHVRKKTLQHAWGIPGLVQRSLRILLSTCHQVRPRNARASEVSISIPELSFLSRATQRELEKNVQKRIVNQRWRLPQRVLDSMKLLYPQGQLGNITGPKPSSSKKLAKESCSVLSCARKQQALQKNLAKRALETQLGVSAPKIQQFRKASPQAPKPALPKVIPPGLRPPELRSQQIHFLDLQALSHIQLNITHKKLTYRLGLPSLYHRSLAQLFPGAVFQVPTFPLPRRSAAFGFTSTHIRFLCPKAREELEWHVRKKTLQHAWGIPGLVQRSLRILLSTCHQVRPRNARASEVSISIPELSFLSRATQRELEKNVQKRIVNQRWRLPQRVLDSMKLLHPQGQLGNITGPKPCAVGRQRRQKAQRMVAPAPPLLPPTQLAKTQVVLRPHLAKKSLEMNLEVFPAAVRVSWRCRLLVLRRPLPKVIRPGHKPLLPRRPVPLSVFAEQVSRIEVAVKCNHLASLWGLGTRYAETLRAMRSPGPSRRRRTAFTFSGVQVTILPQTEAEALERHVSRKRLQHEWGFPVLVQRSLRYLVCEPPPLLPRRQMGVSARVLVQDLCLPQSFRNRLELHVQKMKLQRLWGLPRRVVESLRSLFPELKAAAHRQKSPAERGAESTLRKAGPESLPVTPVVGTLCAVCRKRKADAVSRGFPSVGRQNLEKIRVHSAKKSMEVHWEIFPAVAVSSWRRVVLTSRQPLPKRILRGVKPLQPRKPILTFVLAEDFKRIEVSVQRYHLSSLWGLGQRYVEALSAMAPAPHPQPPRSRKASLGFSQVQTLFLPQEDRESLERHVRKKKLQHEWGFPVSVQSSLRAFMQGPPLPGQVPLPGASRRTKIWVQTMHRELLFLPRSTRVRLEHHIQRLKLQRQWALPRRILESMQLLFPGEKMLPAGSSSRESSFGACAKPWTAGAKGAEPVGEKGRRMVGAAAHSAKLCLPLEGMSLEKLQLHVTKKSLEVHLGAFPAVPRHSRQRASLSLSQTLPRLIRPSLATLRPRSSCLLFSVDQMGQIELAVQHNYLASLWGLGTRYVEAVAAMAPWPPFRTPARRRGAAFEFLAVETLFFQRLSREELELHVRRKRMQHMWEFPALVQRSLWGFMQGPPRLPGLPKTSIQICVLHQELLFLPRRMCRLLEFHIQRRKLQRRWGLPRKVLDSLQQFLPTPPPGRAPLPQSGKEKKLTKATGSRAADARRRKTCNVPPVKNQCLESSTKATLDTHLKKKALESKFQLMKAPAGPIRRAPLPKPPSLPSGVRPRRPLLLFVEQEALLKIQLNIKQKHLTCLWGLPSLQIKSLTKMYGKIPGPLLPGKVATVRSSAKALGRETPKGPAATGLKPWKWGASFLTQDASDLLEMHVLRKKLQHMWGLPATVQKSLSAFLRPPSKLQRSPTRAVKVRVVTTQRLVFLDPVTAGSLEAHLKRRIAAHRWGLPKLVQESVKVFLPPGSAPQADQAQIALCTCSKDLQTPLGTRGQCLRGASSPSQADQTQIALCTCSKDLQTPLGTRGQRLQAAASPSQADQIPLYTCSKDLQMPLGTGGQGLQAAGGEAQSPLEKQVESERQQLPRTGGQPSELSPGGRHPETSRHGREAPKRELDLLPVVTTCLTDEAREYLEFHVKRKRVQHEWSLPSAVQKSLRAFAPPPPELQGPAKARAVVLVSPEKSGGQGKGGAAAHPPQSVTEAMIPRRILRFLCPNVKDCLETHVKRWATEHRWGLPQMVRRSVRAALPAQQKSSAGEKKHPVRLSKRHHDSPQRHEVPSHSEAEESKGLLHAGESKRPVQLSKYHRDSPRQQEIHSHSEGEESPGLLHAGERRYPVEVSKHHRDSSQQCGIHSHSEGEELPGLLHAGERRSPVQVSKHHRVSSQRQEIHSYSEGKESLALQPSQKASPQKPKGHQRKQRPARNVGTTAEISPTLQPPFLTDEAFQLLEFHIIHKRIQHAWATPSILQKSLDALAPFALHRGEDAPKTHRWDGEEVRVIANDLSFLKPDTKERLEAHITTLTTRHRWEIPKRVQQSLKTFMASRPPSRSEVGLLPCQCKSWQAARDDYQTSDDDNKSSPQGTEGRRRATKKQKVLWQGQRGTATRVGHEASVFLFPGVRLPFLQHEAQNALEFHIQRKRLQHAWGLPSAVLRSLQAFAPPPLESHKKRPPRKIVAGRIPWEEGDMQSVSRSLSFLSPERKEHLNGHLRRMIEKRRWGLPERVQQSLRAFMTSRPASQPELGRSRQPLPPPSTSPQDVADSETEGDNQLASGTEGDNEDDSSREATQKPRGKLHHKKEAAASAARVDVSTFFFPEVTSPFLPQKAQNALEFHIQRKRLQHAWGLPSTVLKSLQAFAPPPLESHKKRPPRKIVAGRIPWEEGDMQSVSRSLSFLSPERKEHLNGHLRRMIEKRRWGLPERVQQSLRAFMTSRPASQPELGRSRRPSPPPSTSPQDAADSETEGDNQLASGTEGDNEDDSSREATQKLHHKREAAAAHVDVSTFFFPEVTSPFLPHEAQNALEFHIQRKRLQHAWGLPSTVLRSLQAFAPLPLESHKKRPPRKSVAHPFPWDEGNVKIMTRGLLFINSEVKERLEAHVRSLTAGHRWGLQKHAQEAVRAFRLPRPPSVVEMGPETQEAFRIRSPFELGSSVRKRQDRQNVSGELEEETLLAATLSATSATSISCERELPFLAGHLQDFLEFHIQRKKIQHDWGLPATVQRSLRAFAPVPRGLQESHLPGTGVSIAATRAKGVAAGTRAGTKKGRVGKEVQVGAKQLHFLHAGTKEHLEKHIRGLKVEHRWHVPKVVQESARAFILHAHGPEEEEEQLSTYEQTLDTSDTPFKTETEQDSSSSWEDPRIYHPELFPERGQDSGEASWVETEEPSLCLCGKTRNHTAAQEARGGWEAGRGAPRRSRLQEKPLQGSWLKKPRQVQRSRIPDRMQEPGVPPLSQPTRRPPKYIHNASRRPERNPSSQRVRYTCGRITHLAARSSNTSLGKRNKKTTRRVPWQPEGSFEGMADDSHLSPGQLPLLPKGSEAGWEHRKVCKLPKCSSSSHFSRKATAATSSSSQLAAEQKWRQQDQEEGAENGKEGGSSSLLSEDIEQVPGPSSGESIRDASLPEQEATEVDLRPLQGTESMQQSSLFAPQQAFLEQAYAVEPQASYEDVVARTYRMAGSIRQVKSRSGLRTGGRKVGWGREKRMDSPSQTMRDAYWATDTGRQASSATKELGRCSSESLCQECLSLKSPSWKEGSEEDSVVAPLHQGARGLEEASSDSPKDSEWQAVPASPKEGFLGAEGGFQRHSAPDNEAAVEGQEEQGTSSGSEEQRPVSVGSMSQFSTEWEWEQVGDWDSKEEGFAKSDWMVKEEEEEEGGGSSGGNWPGAGRGATGSRRRENSPTNSHSLASLKKAKASQTALLWEARFVLSNMATESASEPQQAIAKEVTGGMVALGQTAASQGSGERSRYSQFVGTAPSDEKVTLLSKILERKLSLDQGLRVLRHGGERRSK
ncbi:protein SPATA31F1 [Podarcis muralis]